MVCWVYCGFLSCRDHPEATAEMIEMVAQARFTLEIVDFALKIVDFALKMMDVILTMNSFTGEHWRVCAAG